MRLGKFYFGWGEPDADVKFLPELIVCRDAREAERIQHTIGRDAPIAVVEPTIQNISKATYAKITVMPGVDLDRDVGGQGCLRNLLRHRQLTWGDLAVFIEL